MLLNAMPKILESYPELVLDIAGSGTANEIGKMQVVVSTLKLENNVKKTSNTQESFLFYRIFANRKIKKYYQEFHDFLKGASSGTEGKDVVKLMRDKLLDMPDSKKIEIIRKALEAAEEFAPQTMAKMIVDKTTVLLDMARRVDPNAPQFSKNLSYLQSQLEDMKNDIATMNLQARTQDPRTQDPEIRSAIDGYHSLESAVQELQNKEMSV